jgi:hypothetical protein
MCQLRRRNPQQHLSAELAFIMPTSPPPVLDMARLIAYAPISDSVKWTGRQCLFVDGELLGPVPNLAICKNLSGPLTDYLLFHCDSDWGVLGVSGAPDLEQVRAIAERAYTGISEYWIEAETSEEDAEKYVREKFSDSICSFCDRLPAEVDQLIAGNGVQICSTCIAEFHAALGERSQ